jgi:hypothetical protein
MIQFLFDVANSKAKHVVDETSEEEEGCTF